MEPEAAGGDTLEDVQTNLLYCKERHFQAIQQLLSLVVSIIPLDGNNLEDKIIATHKAFDYVDAITNLMVRHGEVVAAVACGGRGGGIISTEFQDRDSDNETPSHENVEVRPQYTSYV